jgi:hypothetical protein
MGRQGMLVLFGHCSREVVLTISEDMDLSRRRGVPVVQVWRPVVLDARVSVVDVYRDTSMITENLRQMRVARQLRLAAVRHDLSRETENLQSLHVLKSYVESYLNVNLLPACLRSLINPDICLSFSGIALLDSNVWRQNKIV